MRPEMSAFSPEGGAEKDLFFATGRVMLTKLVSFHALWPCYNVLRQVGWSAYPVAEFQFGRQIGGRRGVS